MRLLKSNVIIAGLSMLFISQGAFAAEKKAYRPHDKSTVIKNTPEGFKNRGIVLKFHENTGVRLREGKLVSSNFNPGKARIKKNRLDNELASLKKQLKSFDVSIQRRYRQSEEKLDLMAAKTESKRGKETANLNLYFTVSLPKNPEDAKALLAYLNSLDCVEIGYFDVEVPDPAANDTPDYTGNQSYFDGTSTGLGITAARAFAGSLGDNVTIVDIETGFRTTHEDLPANITVISNSNPVREHGTSVVGILVGINDGNGIDGIVPNSPLAFINWRQTSQDQAVLDAIDWIDNNATTPQRVILMETQTSGPSSDGTVCGGNITAPCLLPSEWNAATFNAIETAVYGNNITVIEAAGNGSNDLDDPVYNNLFDPDFRHSGAIMVGAGSSGSLQPTVASNTGARVDVNAWGEDVVSTGYGDLFTGPGNPLSDGADPCTTPCVTDPNRYYTSNFAGTSSASALTAGASGSLLSIAAQWNISVLPQQFSRLIRYTGTPQTSGANIGPRIFLPKATDALADIYPILDWQVPQEYAVSGEEYAILNDRVKCWEGFLNSPDWCTARGKDVTLGADAEMGKIISVDAFLRDRSKVHGDLYAENLSVQNNVVIDGTQFNQSSADRKIPITTYTHQFTGSGQTYIENGNGVLLAPGTYGNYNVRGGAVLAFQSGTYYFNRLEFESNSQVQFFEAGGPIRIYVRDNFLYRGTVNNLTTSQPDEILLGYTGTSVVWVDNDWKGTIVAPNSWVVLGQSNNGRIFDGMFVAKNVSVHQGSRIVFNPFDFDLQ